MNYFKNIVFGMWHLVQGLYITLLNMIRPKITQEYPENRGVRVYPEAFRALLTMPHNDENQHKCTACGICQMNCPNGTIEVISRMEKDPVTGRERKVLDKYMYDLSSCIFCALCTQTCPQDAIEWSNEFEHSVFDKSKLMMQLNCEGSSLAPKPAPAPKPAQTVTPASNPVATATHVAVATVAPDAAQPPLKAAAPATSAVSADVSAGTAASAADPTANAVETAASPTVSSPAATSATAPVAPVASPHAGTPAHETVSASAVATPPETGKSVSEDHSNIE